MGQVSGFLGDRVMSTEALRLCMPEIGRLKNPAAKLVWVKLALAHQRGQISPISVYSLARDLAVDRKTIYRAFDEIEAAGLGTRRPTRGDFIFWIKGWSEPMMRPVPDGEKPTFRVIPGSEK
jgi:hypothetical protein